MKFKKEGFEFNYHGDVITKRWPWFFRSGSKYHSKNYSMYFDNFKTYWRHAGVAEQAFAKSDKKLEGFSYAEIIGEWVRIKYPFEFVVVLKDVNVSERGLSFWAKIPKEKLEHIQKDVIVLRCGTKENACEIVDSIEPEFAEAFAFANGILIRI